MARPTPTAFERQQQKDGRLARALFGRITAIELPESLEFSGDRPTILAGNHQSLLDVFMAAAACHNCDASARFLVQASYFDKFGIGHWLKRIGCIPLNSKTKEAAFIEALAALERREVVGIMPEGRLVPPDERTPQTGPGRPGVVELARDSGAEVRPIAFHNTGMVWPRGKWPRRVRPKPKVTLKVGEPIELIHDDDQANADLIMAAVSAMLDDLDAGQA